MTCEGIELRYFRTSADSSGISLSGSVCPTCGSWLSMTAGRAANVQNSAPHTATAARLIRQLLVMVEAPLDGVGSDRLGLPSSGTLETAYLSTPTGGRCG